MLKQSRGTRYRDKLEEAIRKVKRRGYEDICADMEPYDKPMPIVSRSSELAFTPDITAEKLGGKAYFEIAKRGDDEEKVGSKWRVLATMARVKQGDFKIFVPHGSMPFAQRMVNKHNLSAELIKI